jgi:hypothetical protein
MNFFLMILLVLNLLLILLVFLNNDISKEIENFTEEITITEYMLFSLFFLQCFLLLLLLKF